MIDPTVDTINTYIDVLVSLHRALASDEESIAPDLALIAHGLSTGHISIPQDHTAAMEIWLDLRRHKLVIATSYGTRFELTLLGQTAYGFATACLEAMAILGIPVAFDLPPFFSRALLPYDPEVAASYAASLCG